MSCAACHEDVETCVLRVHPWAMHPSPVWIWAAFFGVQTFCLQWKELIAGELKKKEEKKKDKKDKKREASDSDEGLRPSPRFLQRMQREGADQRGDDGFLRRFVHHSPGHRTDSNRWSRTVCVCVSDLSEDSCTRVRVLKIQGKARMTIKRRKGSFHLCPALHCCETDNGSKLPQRDPKMQQGSTLSWSHSWMSCLYASCVHSDGAVSRVHLSGLPSIISFVLWFSRSVRHTSQMVSLALLPRLV